MQNETHRVSVFVLVFAFSKHYRTMVVVIMAAGTDMIMIHIIVSFIERLFVFQKAVGGT